MFLKPITVKKSYVDLITSKITVWMWTNFFKQCFDILKDNEVLNDASIIREALQSGAIYYQDGAFYAKKKFSNAVALELERMGAKYVKSRKAYVIAKSILPTDIIWAIDTVKATTYAKAMAINQFLLNQLSNMDELLKKMLFDDAVNAILNNIQERVYKNAKQHKIELISPKWTDFRKQEFAQRYTNNLDFWIKNWTETEIVKMRNTVGQMIIDGKSQKTISEYFQKEFGIAQRKAKFLAFNETNIAMTSYLAAKYQEDGFTHFKWVWRPLYKTKPREYHRDILNGQIFRFDDPPIIDEKTGQKGLPSETYNCHCIMSPVINGEFLQNRRKMFQANNSLLDKIKEIWKKAV